jgi:PIN domain nuclease of toxin-antitoxin system
MLTVHICRAKSQHSKLVERCACCREVAAHPGDLYDWLLIAHAMSEPLHLVTFDAGLMQYSELVIQV